MIGKLVGISGPVRGQTFAVTEEDISLGRDSGNSISIKDSSLSRNHCLLKYSDGTLTLEDLKSHNGTVVNGIRLKEPYKLKSKDRIFIGRSGFLFLIEGDDYSSEQTEIVWRQSGDSDDDDSQTTKLALNEAIFPQPDAQSVGQQAVFDRMARNLEALLDVSTAISTIRDRNLLFTRVLEVILEVTRAERGAILLYDDSGTDLKLSFSFNRDGGSATEMKISRTVTKRVVAERVAILSSNLPGDSRFSDSNSLLGVPVRSVICVPLIVFDRLLGLVYIDTERIENLFTDNDLKLVTAIVNQMVMAVDNISYYERLQTENRRLTEQLQQETALVGNSSGLQKIFGIIQRVSSKDSTVLITGESGTGKELIARAIHQASPRRDQPFIPINCAAIPENLLETELFGHEKGAFTGAVTQRKGKLEIADHGTVFLDEVGDIPMQLQVKLLRVLQEREFERVGGNRTIKVNIRVLAATNRELEKAITSGGFREDLFYRLNVVSIKAPALRDRREDVLVLANHFLNVYNRETKKHIRGFSEEAKAALLNYSWPGNVRELQNAVEHAAVLGEGEWVAVTDLPDRISGGLGLGSKIGGEGYHEAIKELKRRVIITAFNESNGSLSETARLLKLNPTYLSRLIKVLEIQLPSKARPIGK